MCYTPFLGQKFHFHDNYEEADEDCWFILDPEILLYQSDHYKSHRNSADFGPDPVLMNDYWDSCLPSDTWDVVQPRELPDPFSSNPATLSEIEKVEGFVDNYKYS